MQSKTEPNQKQMVTINVRLKGNGTTDHPVLANYTSVQLGQGLAYLDMGFLEPALLTAIGRKAQQDGAAPTQIEGTLVGRVAMPLDSLARLQQQLHHLIAGLEKKDSAA